ncbi:hypothetical protein GCK72_017123 [Caenorhabditis remanei]|uniref:Uncharacterized protein n=1 Tax=Caenorhabditis remanei TaxID=31234 RepID=A0A6A5G797_CAERE|nr:hypothetical protein GCK72_017123 [Caenorhabditis remanei]KAF1750572.1 hypothetical protein GCK72_017123 [Caenorhabditis remanei]
MPKNTKKGGNKKLQLSNKQFEDLLKEIGGGLPEGMALDPALLATLREATNTEFNKVAKEKYGDVQVESDDDGEEQKSSEPKNGGEGSSNKA